MPINFTSRTITSSDPFAKTAEARTPSDDEILSKWIFLTYSSYVLLGPESTKEAAGCDVDPSTHMLILHCDETMRSCVVVTGHVARLAFQTYDSHLSYVTCGAQKPLVHALVLHGSESTPSTLGSLTSKLRASAASMGFRIKVVTRETPGRASAVLFKRASTTVELLLKSPHADFEQMWWPQLDVEVFFPGLWSDFMHLQNLLDVSEGQVVSTIPCMYDGQSYPERLPVLSDEARSILATIKEELAAAVKGGQTPKEFFRTTNMDAPLRGIPFTGLEDSLRELLVPVAALAPFCNVCAKMGVSKQCAGCGSEYYCSPEHQRADWPRHESW